jgi:F0F1-type ATP synthase membrane subunit b/b'
MATAKMNLLSILVFGSLVIPVMAVSPEKLKEKIDERCGEACSEIAEIQRFGLANPARRGEALARLDNLQDKLKKSREKANRIKSEYKDADRADVDQRLAAARARINGQFDTARRALGAPVATVPAPAQTYGQRQAPAQNYRQNYQQNYQQNYRQNYQQNYRQNQAPAQAYGQNAAPAQADREQDRVDD